MELTIIEVIKGMLAPGIMISACGLLLLGMNNKYSMVVSRIRALNSEFRTLQIESTERRDCILVQLPLLMDRLKTIRNAVWFYTTAIGLFIFAILSLGLHFLTSGMEMTKTLALLFFILAMVAVFIGIMHAAREVLMAFRILRIETKNILPEEN